jgi:enediyne biosynthesis protein E4
MPVGNPRKARSSILCAVQIATAVLCFALCSCNRAGVDPAAPGTIRQAGDDLGSGDIFADITAASGIDHSYRSGQEAGHYAILEVLGGGVGLLDYNGDGLLDIFVTGGGYFDGPGKKETKGHPCKLYKNLGNWKFKDVTAEVGLDHINFYNHGCAVGDYDRDGWPDLVVTGYGAVALFHNESDGKGGRHFVDVTKESGLECEHSWSTSAGFADLDGDGYPDLYICHYVDWSWANNPICGGFATGVKRDVCPPAKFGALAHALYHNVPAEGQGKGTSSFDLRARAEDGRSMIQGRTADHSPLTSRHFVDVSKEAGLRVPPRADQNYGKGLGVLLVDVNNDGKPDIYVANDTTDNFLYFNESSPGRLRFKEMGQEMGVARDAGGVADGSMGVDADDYDGSGLAAIWVTNYEGQLHSLYKNVMTGKRQYFRYVTQAAGIAVIGQQYVGFGTGFLDLDNDGWLDLMISNGHVLHHPFIGQAQQRPVLLHNAGKGRFRDMTARGGPYFLTEHAGRGVAIGDLNNQGRADLVISHVDEPIALLRHGADDKGPPAHWLGIELARKDYGDIVGARVVVEVGERRLTRFAKGGGSYLSSGDRRLLFGLGNAEQIGRVTVYWPFGEIREQVFSGLGIDRYWKLEQGRSPQPGTRPIQTAARSESLKRDDE